MMAGSALASPRSILVRGPNWLGDLVMSTPGLRALRGGHPDARITLVVRRGLEGVLEGAPWIDRIVPLDADSRSPLRLLREGLALRRQGRADLALCIPDSYSSALHLRAAGARHIVGYPRAGRGPLLHRAVPVPVDWGRRRLVPRERFVLGLVEALGLPAQGTRLELFTTEAEEARLEAVLAGVGAQLDAPLVLAPGASYGPSKLWPARSYAALGDALAREGHSICVVGSPAERALTAGIVEAMQAPAVDLGGRLDLGALKALLRRACLLVGNDAGARHIAVAFERPCVIFFGPTAVEKTAMNLDRVSVLTHEADCRPCYRRVCPIDHRCMTGIGVERALATARERIAEGARA